MCQTNALNVVENGNKAQTSLPSAKKGFYIDDAISKTDFGLFNYILMFNCGMVMAALIMETIGITFVLPVSQCDLNLTTSEKGILGAAGFFGIIASSHLWGYLSDVKGRHRVMHPTLLIAFIMSVLSSFVNNFYLLTLLRFFNGFFIAGSAGTIYVYLSEFHNDKQRSRVIMGSSVIFGVLCILMPLIAWAVINQEWQFFVPIVGIIYKPWRFFLVVCSLPGLLSYLILTFLPESPRFVLNQGRAAETYGILEKMNRINKGKNSQLERFDVYEDAESIESRQRILNEQKSSLRLLKSVWNQSAPLFAPPHLFSTILICLIQFSIFYTCQGFNVFFVEILNKIAANVDNLVDERVNMCDVINMKQDQTDENIGDQNCNVKLELAMLQQGIILQVLFAGGYFIVSLLINRISKFPIIFTILAGAGLCGIGCMWTEIPLLQICLFTVHIASGVGSNVLNTTTVELYPTNLRAMAICISLMFGRLGSMTGSNVAAYLLQNQYCETTFYSSGLSLIVAGALAFFLPNIHQKVTKLEKS